ncbi:hypothetical protein D7Z54_13575 [Salibacterium salarium]|uniref:Uncharacterized protein n=1 Tax=Salibacterium salarium TaxID=284579 RepID=A0A3R9P8N5_9BACI|nr:hypothetical protein [Salibacterium salarium]RSL32771.1 hypothetical protein D7Z54_13575 [Salibacterium salarium]
MLEQMEATKENYNATKAKNYTNREIARAFQISEGQLYYYKKKGEEDENNPPEAVAKVDEDQESFNDEVNRKLKQELEKWKSRALAAENKVEKQSQVDRENGNTKKDVQNLKNTLSQTKENLNTLRADYQTMKKRQVDLENERKDWKARAEKAESELADLDEMSDRKTKGSGLLQNNISQLSIMLCEAHEVDQ